MPGWQVLLRVRHRYRRGLPGLGQLISCFWGGSADHAGYETYQLPLSLWETNVFLIIEKQPVCLQ